MIRKEKYVIALVTGLVVLNIISLINTGDSNIIENPWPTIVIFSGLVTIQTLLIMLVSINYILNNFIESILGNPSSLPVVIVMIVLPIFVMWFSKEIPRWRRILYNYIVATYFPVVFLFILKLVVTIT